MYLQSINFDQAIEDQGSNENLHSLICVTAILLLCIIVNPEDFSSFELNNQNLQAAVMFLASADF